jgi:hypothetical protein
MNVANMFELNLAMLMFHVKSHDRYLVLHLKNWLLKPIPTWIYGTMSKQTQIHEFCVLFCKHVTK